MRIFTPLLTCFIACGFLAVTGPLMAQSPTKPPTLTEFSLGDAQFKGEVLRILGQWSGREKTRFEMAVAPFETATGIDVRFTGSSSYEEALQIAVESGTPPDLAIISQPGLGAQLAARGQIAPLRREDADWVRKNYAAGDSWVALTEFKGPDGTINPYGIFFRVDVKSLVWYRPDVFAEMGYAPPKTQQELRALEAQMRADGLVPWCIGLGSGGATGWPATDWIEDDILRQHGPVLYDQWVQNKVRFDDPRIVATLAKFAAQTQDPKTTFGGAALVASQDFRDASNGIFHNPPRCMMAKQASFITGFFPDGVTPGEDVDLFYYPHDPNAGTGKPLMGSGTFVSITKDSPAARAFIEYLKNPLPHEIWMAEGGFLTPHRDVNLSKYNNDIQRKMGAMLQDADVFRFDGSDVMPAAIGTDAFWHGMVEMVQGASPQDTAAKIQTRWDQIK